MKTQIMPAHFAPHFHAGGAGFFLILFFSVVAIALILAGIFIEKGK